jgi:hypothetical protein
VLTWLVLGILFGVLVTGRFMRRSRQRFQAVGSAFRCRLRVRGHRSRRWPLLGRQWSRPMWARWDGDVLIVRRGPGRAIRLHTRSLMDGVQNLIVGAPRWCGSRPVGVVLQIGDGSRIEVAAGADHRLEVVGPYLAAAVSDLPKAPAPRRYS